jgi:hypothetical protein
VRFDVSADTESFVLTKEYVISRAILDRKDRTKSSTGASGDVEMVDVCLFVCFVRIFTN